MTNGDKIRAMSDKEIAIAVANILPDCLQQPFICFGTVRRFFEWLQEEVEE